jgi:endonuclease III
MAARTTEKRPHDIHVMLRRIEKAVEPFAKAALFELAELGFTTPFEQLVACIISIRSLDEVTLPAAQRLFAVARTPAEVAALKPAAIDKLIHPATFHERKAVQIRGLAQILLERHGGELPCDRELMMSFPGVGPKCANLALGIACAQAVISVDVHVHRVTNRWGYVATNAPEQTMLALADRLPKQYWVDINRLLVPFGKHICTGRAPRCSTCPVLEYCQQVGVTAHR